MDVAQYTIATLVVVEPFLHVIIDESELNKLREVRSILSQHFVAFLCFSNCKMVKGRSYQNSSLANVLLILDVALSVILLLTFY